MILLTSSKASDDTDRDVDRQAETGDRSQSQIQGYTSSLSVP